MSSEKVSSSLRIACLERDHYRCRACGFHDPMSMQADHIVPRSLGGRDTLSNLQTFCNVCNNLKGNVNTGELPILPPIEGFGDYATVQSNRTAFQSLVKECRQRMIDNATTLVRGWRAEGVRGVIIRNRLEKILPIRHVDPILRATK